MGISVFPAGGGEFVTNDFVIDMNDTTNNVADLGRSYAAGSYGVTLSSGDTSFDIYVLDADGNSVGYTNNASLVATAQFTQIVILGVASSEVISFDYDGAVTNASGEGTAPGAGAYLTSISPFDLPNVDDTANVVGGNFATDVDIFFDSGTVTLSAKSVTRADSTALIVTRPDNLTEDLEPWDVRAVNPGVTPPTGSNDHILAGTVTAGSDPTWVTTSPLTSGTINSAYLATVVATDPDGDNVDYSLTSGSLPAGLSLDGATGVISGTPTASAGTFTLTAADESGNTTARAFEIPLVLATGGSVTVLDGVTYHTFTSTDDFVALAEITDAEIFVIAGGGGGGVGQYATFNNTARGAGAGGAGGLLQGTATLSAGTIVATVGAGGAAETQGSNSSFGTVVVATGGGRGGGQNVPNAGGDGGSGGGGWEGQSGGSGVAGQGNDGGAAQEGGTEGGGGGGKGAVGTGDGGDGSQFTTIATVSGVSVDGGYFAGGGGGGRKQTPARTGGLGGGATGGVQTSSVTTNATNGSANTGGGGGGGADDPNLGGKATPGLGGSGMIVVSY